MVNESNKPQLSLEHEQLGQRLAASNQALADMQAEHRQLLEEMEQLKQRAEALQRLREQQEREEEESRQKYQQLSSATSETTQVMTESTSSAKSDNSKETNEVEENPNDQAEEADYIKEKLAEIARLKAQFKRVQHMINTTELIENHISKKEKEDKHSVEAEPVVVNNKNKETVAPAIQELPSSTGLPAANLGNIENLTMPNMPTLADLNAAATTDEKEQLIMTMLSMFQDFSSDLKSQADSLRAERARIRELKESIIRSKKQQPK